MCVCVCVCVCVLRGVGGRGGGVWRCWKRSTETIRTLRDGEPSRTATSTSTQLLSSDQSKLKSCFTSTETLGLLGTGAQDVHLDFHTPSELSDQPCVQCCFTFAETVLWTIRDGEESPGCPPRHPLTQLLTSDQSCVVQCCFTSTETIKTIRDGDVEGSPGR